MKVARNFCIKGVPLLLMFWASLAGAGTWQQALEASFDIVDTFDELQDWTPGGKWYSAAGCPTCLSNSTLPRKLNGSPSIWGIWNNKGLAFQYTPASGTFAMGDVIKGSTSGATGTVARVWNLDGKWYIQLTNGTVPLQGTSNFLPGETVTSGTKSGLNLQWPLFIADHGAAYTWRRTGKSLVMDLGDNDNVNPADPTMAGLGAQRLATFFGDGVSGKSGYKKVFVFLMMKVAPTFFPKSNGSSYDSVAVVKVFDLASGFINVSQWGTPSEAAQVSSTNNIINEYGLNFSIFNFHGGGLSFPQSLFFAENIYVPSGTSPNYTYSQTISNRMVRSGTSLDVNAYIASGEWFGIEIASDIGTLGNSDGSTDFWVYDKTGAEKGHYSVTGENRMKVFDHLYNKFVLGGNRRSVTGATGGIDSRWWIDDVVIDGSRIGPNYFQLLAAHGLVEPTPGPTPGPTPTPTPTPLVDRTLPLVSISSPISGETVRGSVIVTASATDNVGVARVEFYVNGLLKGADTASPYTFSWNTYDSGSGAHTLSAKARDAAGNVGTSTPVSVTVKRYPKAPSITRPK